MQRVRRRRVGEILISEGLITQEHLNVALERQRETSEPVGEILISQGVLSENDLVRAICIQHQFPFIRPTDYQIAKSLIDQFTVDFLFKNKIVPLDQIGEVAIVTIGDLPSDEVQQQLTSVLGPNVYYYFSAPTDVEAVLRDHFSLSQEQMLALKANKPLEEPTISMTAAGEEATGDHGNLLDTLDSSWEAIFEESEGP